MDWFRGPIPQKDQMMKLPLDTGRTRGNQPVGTPLESTGRTGARSFSQNEVSAVVEAGRDCFIETEPVSGN